MVKKNPENQPFLICGCQVLEGRGKILVIAVGPNSQWGKLKALAEKDSEETPLQQHLKELADTIGKMGLVAAILTFVIFFDFELGKKTRLNCVLVDFGDTILE